MVIRQNGIEVLCGIVGEIQLRKVRNGAVTNVAPASNARSQRNRNEQYGRRIHYEGMRKPDTEWSFGGIIGEERQYPR